MDKINIRSATVDDLDSIQKLQQHWHDEDITWGYVADTVEGIRRFVIEQYCLVAELEGKLIGYVLGQVLPNPDMAALPDMPCLEIADLYVVPVYRSNGIGSALLDSLLKNARATGITSFKLFSSTKDILRIVSFYEQHGFSVVSVNMVRK